jgi:endogenous inhibitor of DNA gyrase (YacG/DUF329 family)
MGRAEAREGGPVSGAVRCAECGKPEINPEATHPQRPEFYCSHTCMMADVFRRLAAERAKVAGNAAEQRTRVMCADGTVRLETEDECRARLLAKH